MEGPRRKLRRGTVHRQVEAMQKRIKRNDGIKERLALIKVNEKERLKIYGVEIRDRDENVCTAQ